MNRSAWCALLLAACGGGKSAVRPLDLEIRGLSARATILDVKMFPDGSGQTCADVDLGTAAALAAPIALHWSRDSGADRRFEVPAIEEPAITVVAFSSDGAGAVIQFACRRVDFAELSELPGGRLVVTLSRRI